MGTSKKLLLYMLAGALIGNIAAMIISPAILVWYETPGDPGALCNCVTTVRTTTSHFIRGQLIGADDSRQNAAQPSRSYFTVIATLCAVVSPALLVAVKV